MEALPKEITDEIRSIVTRCYLGELEHNQKKLHCGTAHCVAGWKQVLDKRHADEFAWKYAEYAWDLTADEASILFDAAASFKQQFALIEALERGERITTFDEYDAFYESLENGIRVPTLPKDTNS